MIISNFETEKELLENDYALVIGIDEAGRGPLAGPVVAGAATFKSFSDLDLENKCWNLIRDSKTLSLKQREKAFDFVMENFYVGIGICDHQTIDRINILEASFLAMKKSLSDLSKNIRKNGKTMILLDGNKKIPNFSGEQKAIISGDKLVKSISAASIVAKVTRDRMMLEFHKAYPEYYFNKHKGYGTKLHLDCLNEHGPSEIHRQSFAPVKNLAKS